METTTSNRDPSQYADYYYFTCLDCGHKCECGWNYCPKCGSRQVEYITSTSNGTYTDSRDYQVINTSG